VCRRCVRIGKEEGNERNEAALDGVNDRRVGCREGGTGARVEMCWEKGARSRLTDLEVGAEVVFAVSVSRTAGRIGRMMVLMRVIDARGWAFSVSARTIQRVVKRTRLKTEALSRRAEQEEDNSEQGEVTPGSSSDHDVKPLFP
jgi:hypothetical protein